MTDHIFGAQICVRVGKSACLTHGHDPDDELDGERRRAWRLVRAGLSEGDVTRAMNLDRLALRELLESGSVPEDGPKTKIRLAPWHPVSKHQQSEITLHGGFEFLGAAYVGRIFTDDEISGDFVVGELRAPGGEALQLYVRLDDVERQAWDAEKLRLALLLLAECARANPGVSRSIDAQGRLRDEERAAS
jgi:hypothetical protein